MLGDPIPMSRHSDLKITRSTNESLSCIKHFSENSSELQKILETILGPVHKQKLPIHLWLVDHHRHTTHQRVHVDPRGSKNEREFLTGHTGVRTRDVVIPGLDRRDTRENHVEVLVPELIRDLRHEIQIHALLSFTEPMSPQSRETLEAEESLKSIIFTSSYP